MARPPKDVRIAGAFVTPGERAGWVRTGATTAVPSQIVAQLHLVEPSVEVKMFIAVDAGARAEIREFAVSPRNKATAISNSLLRRIPIDYLMRAALERASVTVAERSDIQPGAFQLPGDPEHQAWVSPPPPPEAGRGQQMSPERVQKAAEVYRQALATGSRSPGMVVAETLHYSRATAARDIRLARERGLLPADDANAATFVPSVTSDEVPPNPIWRSLGDSETWEPLDQFVDKVDEAAKHPGKPSAAAGDAQASGETPGE